MGTRSLTFVYDDLGNKIINMYRQMDGYPSGHGQELAEFLAPIKLVNGIGLDRPAHTANGMPCLAAQIVANFKTRVGEYYLYPIDMTSCGQDYNYHIYTDKVVIIEEDYSHSLFSGTWDEFYDFCNTYQE
jgi:hypothetical protein